MLSTIGKRILVQPIQNENTTKILLANAKPTNFIVKYIGDEVTKVKPDDVLYLDKYIGTEIEYEGQKYIVIQEDNILAKVN